MLPSLRRLWGGLRGGLSERTEGMAKLGGRADREQTRSAQAYLLMACIGIVLVLALGLRMQGLSEEDVWYDEAVSYINLDAPDLITFLQKERALDPPMTPVYFTLQYVWARIFGISNFSVRMLSVLMGVGTVYVLYRIGRELYGPSAGLFSALCLTLAPSGIYFAQELRTYSLVLLLASLSIWTLVRACNSDRPFVYWLGNIAVNGLLIWTHYFAALLPLSQGLFAAAVFWRKPVFLGLWMSAHALLALSLIPWLLRMDASALDAAADWLPMATFDAWLHVVGLQYVGVRIIETFTPYGASGGPSWIQYALPVLALGLALLAVRTAFRTRTASPTSSLTPPRRVALLGLLYLGPPTLLAALSMFYRPCFIGRYTLYASLPLFLLLGGGLSAISSRTIQTAAAVLYVSGMAYLALNLERPIRPPYSEVEPIIRERDGSQPRVVTGGLEHLPLRVYSDFSEEELVYRETLAEQIALVTTEAATGRIVWFVRPLCMKDRSEVEAQLGSAGFAYETFQVGGLYPLTFYRVSASPSAASAKRKALRGAIPPRSL